MRYLSIMASCTASAAALVLAGSAPAQEALPLSVVFRFKSQSIALMFTETEADTEAKICSKLADNLRTYFSFAFVPGTKADLPRLDIMLDRHPSPHLLADFIPAGGEAPTQLADIPLLLPGDDVRDIIPPKAELPSRIVDAFDRVLRP